MEENAQRSAASALLPSYDRQVDPQVEVERIVVRVMIEEPHRLVTPTRFPNPVEVPHLVQVLLDGLRRESVGHKPAANTLRRDSKKLLNRSHFEG